MPIQSISAGKSGLRSDWETNYFFLGGDSQKHMVIAG